MNVRPRVSASDLTLVPKDGPVVAVANHPFGLIKGAILGSVLATVRPDVKVMANHLLTALPEARQYSIGLIFWVVLSGHRKTSRLSYLLHSESNQ